MLVPTYTETEKLLLDLADSVRDSLRDNLPLRETVDES